MLIETLIFALFIAMLFHIALLLYYNKINNERYDKKEGQMIENVMQLINKIDNLEDKLLRRK